MASSQTPLIKFENISKHFGPFKAVENLNLEVYEGEIIGLVGPNGAGKTTTIKMLANLLTPTHGSILIQDLSGALQDISLKPKNVYKRGFLIDIPDFYEGNTAYQLLKYFAKLQKYPKKDINDQIDKVLGKVDLLDWKHEKVKIYSKGMKQKLGIAQAIIHDPKIIVLDEPQTGLDPRARIEIRKILRELQKEGKTIFLSSHLLYEITEVCDKIALINRGELIEFGKITDLEKKMRSHEIRSELLEPINPKDLNDVLSMLENKLKPYIIEEAAYKASHHILYEPSEQQLKILFDGKPESQHQILKLLINETQLKVSSYYTSKTSLLERFYIDMVDKDNELKNKEDRFKND